MGKISVKHYLNKQVKPEIKNEIEYYPLYVSITVNRKNIRFKSFILEDGNKISEIAIKDNVLYDEMMLEKINLELITRQFISDIDNKLIKIDDTNFSSALLIYINTLNKKIDDIFLDYFKAELTNELKEKSQNTADEFLFKISTFSKISPENIENIISELLPNSKLLIYNRLQYTFSNEYEYVFKRNPTIVDCFNWAFRDSFVNVKEYKSSNNAKQAKFSKDEVQEFFRLMEMLISPIYKNLISKFN